MLYLVNGEPSVWAAAAQGVAAVCLCGGEGAKLTRDRLAELRGALTGLPPVGTHIVYDLDAPGRAGAQEAGHALVAGGFPDVAALDIAAALPGVAGADVGDLQREVGAGLADALAKLPPLPADPDPSISKRTPPPSTDEAAPTSPSACPSLLFTKDGRFIPARCGAYLTTEATILLSRDRRLWRYVGGVFRPDADDWIAERVRDLVGEKFQRQQIDQVTAWLRAQFYRGWATSLPPDSSTVATGSSTGGRASSTRTRRRCARPTSSRSPGSRGHVPDEILHFFAGDNFLGRARPGRRAARVRLL